MVSYKKIISLLPRPLLTPLKKIKGLFSPKNKVNFFKYYNNYNPGDRTIIPKYFNLNNITSLCKIMKDYGTDKALYQGVGRHNYTVFYYKAFKQFENKSIKLFELGLGTTNPSISANMGSEGVPGASLKGWKKYFKFGSIYGADIDKTILFEEERIKTFFCDQTDKTLIDQLWQQPELEEKFDIIIDDGLHEHNANKFFFDHSYHKLKSGGLYIIEDIASDELEIWKEYIQTYTKTLKEFRFTILKIPNDFNKWDNNLIVVERLS